MGNSGHYPYYLVSKVIGNEKKVIGNLHPSFPGFYLQFMYSTSWEKGQIEPHLRLTVNLFSTLVHSPSIHREVTT